MNRLLLWDFAIFLNSLRCILLDFKFWDAPSLTFPTHLGNTKSLVFIRAWSSILFGNSCDVDKSTLYVPGSPYLVHSCASDVIWWMAKHYCQVRAGLGPRLQRHKCQVRAGLGLRLLWVNLSWENIVIIFILGWHRYQIIIPVPYLANKKQ